MEEAEDEPLFCERAAGTGIGKQAVMVTIRVPSETRRGGRARGGLGSQAARHLWNHSPNSLWCLSDAVSA